MRNNEQETFGFCNVKIEGSTGERCSKVFSGWVEMNQFGEAERQWAWTTYSICFVAKRSKRKQESKGTSYDREAGCVVELSELKKGPGESEGTGKRAEVGRSGLRYRCRG